MEGFDLIFEYTHEVLVCKMRCMEHCCGTAYKCWSETTYHEFHPEELPRRANHITIRNQSSERAGSAKRFLFLLIWRYGVWIDTHLIMKYNLATDNIICDYF